MDNKNIAKLSIVSRWTPPYIAFSIIWWIISAIAFYITGPNLDYQEKFTKVFRYRCMWGMVYYRNNSHIGSYYNKSTFALCLLITVLVFALPFFIKLLDKFIANRCFLALEEDQIVGSLRMPLSTKKIQMPIEKLDNVFTSHGLMDSLRGGDTVAIHSNSGVVKFHYVQNASEFSAAAVKQIEKYKGSISTAQPTPVIQKDASLTEKIQELQRLKEMGVLSDEEFEAKRKELIAKL